MGETDLESQTSAQQDNSVRSSSYSTIDYDERSFAQTNDGRRYEKYGESPVEPFSSYRNSTSVPQPIDDFPNELCQNLNCWQTAPHQHTIEELQYLMEKTHSRLERDPSINEEQVQKQRPATKIAKKPSMRRRSSRGLNSLLDNSARMTRDLKRTLPDTSKTATQIAKDQSHRAQLFNHVSSNRTFTLALRPTPSRQSLVETDEAEIAEPAGANSSRGRPR